MTGAGEGGLFVCDLELDRPGKSGTKTVTSVNSTNKGFGDVVVVVDEAVDEVAVVKLVRS